MRLHRRNFDFDPRIVKLSRIVKTAQNSIFLPGRNLSKFFVPFIKTDLQEFIYFSELSVSGMHHSLAKQDAFIAIVNFKVLPINEAPLTCILLRNHQMCA
jgi:hypothetical protein